MERLHCSILDPTGNITALVEGDAAPERFAETAAVIMQMHPEVEQVGFLRPAAEPGVQAQLRMAGGEFCGNASMCAAALLTARTGGESAALRLRVSGAREPVELKLRRDGAAGFSAAVRMPPALGITESDFAFEDLRGALPLVRMEGISHIIIPQGSVFYRLLDDHAAAERAVRQFCAQLDADGLGLLFLSDGAEERAMAPLVFVPGSGTVFWENSCASGSAAVGMWLAEKSGGPVRLTLREPGGALRVESGAGGTVLFGHVRLLSQFECS